MDTNLLYPTRRRRGVEVSDNCNQNQENDFHEASSSKLAKIANFNSLSVKAFKLMIENSTGNAENN